MRALIVGNSGSGKTWLAERLARVRSAAVVHLDDIVWQPGGFDIKRSPEEILTLVMSHASQPRWVAEGVFGDLAEKFITTATEFVWLDLPWNICEERLRARGSESNRHMGREQSELGLLKLIAWAEDYESRTGDCSSSAHQALYARFSGKKHRLQRESEVMRYLNAA